MKRSHHLLQVIAALCLLLAACGDKHAPVKPTVTVQAAAR